MLMRRRLYFILPDTRSARELFDEMLLARIEERRMHFLSRRGSLPGDLPEATLLPKTDAVHGAYLGIAIGGVLAVLFPPGGLTLQFATVLAAALLGAFLGAWISSLAGTAVPNSQLARFHADIERGKVLMMIDVPVRRIKEISALVAQRHPEAVAGGFEATLVFP